MIELESTYLYVLAIYFNNLLFSLKKNHNNKRKYWRLCMC